MIHIATNKLINAQMDKRNNLFKANMKDIYCISPQHTFVDSCTEIMQIWNLIKEKRQHCLRVVSLFVIVM